MGREVNEIRLSEKKIQDGITVALQLRGWHVERLVGFALQRGLPDLMAFHPKFSYRFIEVKRPKGYRFTKAQVDKFPKLVAHGVGIWVLTCWEDNELAKLFQPPNLSQFLDISKYPSDDVDKLLADITL